MSFTARIPVESNLHTLIYRMNESKLRVLHVLGGDTLRGGCGKTVDAMCRWRRSGYDHGVLVHKSFKEVAASEYQLIKVGASRQKQGSILHDLFCVAYDFENHKVAGMAHYEGLFFAERGVEVLV